MKVNVLQGRHAGLVQMQEASQVGVTFLSGWKSLKAHDTVAPQTLAAAQVTGFADFIP